MHIGVAEKADSQKTLQSMVQATELDGTPFCYINGKRHLLPQGRAEATLLQFLRG